MCVLQKEEKERQHEDELSAVEPDDLEQRECILLLLCILCAVTCTGILSYVYFRRIVCIQSMIFLYVYLSSTYVCLYVAYKHSVGLGILFFICKLRLA